MAKSNTGTTQKNDWKPPVRKVYLYILYFMILYALWMGIRMSQMLSEGMEIPSLFKSGHVHTLGVSFLLLFLLYDMKIKGRLENISIHWGVGEIIIGIAIVGSTIATVGFSLAGMQPALRLQGVTLVSIGESMVLYCMLSYLIASLIEELYK